jgi:hypothetical protein
MSWRAGEGCVAEDFGSDEAVNRIFYQRTGPISAAILIDIDLPDAAVEPQ